jgi:5-methylcytosine-specific restriction endonuclease McrA
MTDPKPKFELEPWNRGVSDEELLADLKRVAGDLGRETVTYSEYDAFGRCRSRTVEVRLGGWNKALARAGLTVARQVGFSDEDFFENLEEVWTRLGRQPREHEMTRPLSRISKGSYSRRFGGWRKALEAFVEWVNAERSEVSPTQTDAFDRSSSHRTPRNPSLRLKFIVMRRDPFSCRHCGQSPVKDVGVVLHVDHVLSWSQGGETTLDNLQILCESCNLGKSNLTETSSG